VEEDRFAAGTSESGSVQLAMALYSECIDITFEDENGFVAQSKQQEKK